MFDITPWGGAVFGNWRSVAEAKRWAELQYAERIAQSIGGLQDMLTSAIDAWESGNGPELGEILYQALAKCGAPPPECKTNAEKAAFAVVDALDRDA